MKALVTPRSFAGYSKKAIEILNEAGIEIVYPKNSGIQTKEWMQQEVKDVDAIIVGVDPLDAEVLKEANQLKVISKYGVGTDNIDLDYAKENNIDVCITSGANSDAVADYAFALLLNAARRANEIDRGCRNDDWSKKIAIDIFGKKIGILGLGQIGKGVALRAKGFDMEIYGYDIYEDKVFNEEHNIKFTSVEQIIKECDFISIHLPLVESTKHLFDEKAFKQMKSNAVLVNTARGGIIKEDALYEALKTKEIYAAGIDVFEKEPANESKLLELENVIIGSHCAASSIGAVDKMSEMAARNVVEKLKERI